jgi:hypothetical protein
MKTEQVRWLWIQIHRQQTGDQLTLGRVRRNEAQLRHLLFLIVTCLNLILIELDIEAWCVEGLWVGGHSMHADGRERDGEAGFRVANA